jgi:protein-tyrosine phosphatase
MASRDVPVDGLVNIRDLGGIPTADGRLVRARQVIRSDNPRGMTSQGQADLSGLVAPALIVDLRVQIEVQREGYEIAHDPARIVNLPMVPQSAIGQADIVAGLADNLVDDYLLQLEANADAIVGALRLIADPDNRPVVVHCTAGKDRTGIVVAMLLSILGVEREVIVEDYHLTSRNTATILERVRSAPVFQENGLATAPEWIFASEPETMRTFLEHMADRYGSAEQWALDHGLAAVEIEQLRATLLA